MNKMETPMQKAQNAKTIFSIILLFISLLYSCAAQHIDVDAKLSYQLIETRYGDRTNETTGFLYYKTIDPKNYPEISEIDTLTTFISNNIIDLVKCNVDSMFSKEQISLINNTYKHLESVELKGKFFKDESILNLKLGDFTAFDYGGSIDGATVIITFPIIIKTEKNIYAILLEISPGNGRFFLYKKEKGDWVVICSSTLYLV